MGLAVAKKRATKRKPVRLEWSAPTPERQAKGRLITTETIIAGVRVWQDREPLKLDQYFDRGRITDMQHQAGERFRELWMAAGREPGSTLDYNPLRSRYAQQSDTQALLDRQCRDAERSIPGPCILAVLAVTCWDQHAPIEPVREGLDALARHFNISARKSVDMGRGMP